MSSTEAGGRGVKRRVADNEGSGERDKRAKTKKQWRVPRKDGGAAQHPSHATIQPGDTGIWITCARNREGKTVGELRDLFGEYAEELYGEAIVEGNGTADHPGLLQGGDDDNDDDEDGTHEPSSIEDSIKAEVAGIRKPSPAAALFTSVKITVPCLIFFKTRSPVEPVSFVRRICEDALAEQQQQQLQNHHPEQQQRQEEQQHEGFRQRKGQRRLRFAQRLCPMTLMGHASEDGLAKLAREVLAPYFHRQQDGNPTSTSFSTSDNESNAVEAQAQAQAQQPTIKFAVRANMRNHNVLKRETIYSLVADVVGAPHKVDLKGYDLLILVEVYQNVCGMSVVDAGYERLKRFNLAEIYEVRRDVGGGGGGGRLDKAERKGAGALGNGGEGVERETGDGLAVVPESVKEGLAMDTN